MSSSTTETSDDSKTSHARSTRAQTVAGAVAVALLAIACGWQSLFENPAFVIINLVVALAFVVIGLLLKDEPERRVPGWCFVAAGAFFAMRWACTWDVGPLPLLGITSDISIYVLCGVANLRVPNRRNLTPTDYALMALLCALFLNRACLVLLSQPEWLGYSSSVWWPSLATTELAFSTANKFVYLTDALTAIAISHAVLTRVRRSAGVERTFSAPIVVALCIAAAS